MTSVVLWPALPVPPGGDPESTGTDPTGPAPTGLEPTGASLGDDSLSTHTPPLLVVAGAECHDLVAALLDAVLPEQPGGAHLILRGGPAQGGRAYIPGHREPRELTAAGVACGPPTRPPRRIEVTHPAELLEYLHLVIAPPGRSSIPRTEILADALRQADGLVYVLDAAAPLTPSHRDELAALARTTTYTLLVDTRDATDAERATITQQVPELDTALWCRTADPAGVVAVLRDWPRPPVEAVAAPPTLGPPRVTDNDLRWRSALAHELRLGAEAARKQLTDDLVALETRCAVEPAALPVTLDVELHALSLRATAALDRTARAVIRTVFAEVVPAGLSDPLLARVTAAVSRDLEPDERTLLVTATAGVAVVTGTAGLSATGSAVPAVAWPVGVAVSGNCHLMWRYRGVPDKIEGRRWLHQAVQAVDRELGRLLAERVAALGEAVEALAGDAVDHGVLLV
jgi:hypothetical protein